MFPVFLGQFQVPLELGLRGQFAALKKGPSVLSIRCFCLVCGKRGRSWGDDSGDLPGWVQGFKEHQANAAHFLPSAPGCTGLACVWPGRARPGLRSQQWPFAVTERTRDPVNSFLTGEAENGPRRPLPTKPTGLSRGVPPLGTVGVGKEVILNDGLGSEAACPSCTRILSRNPSVFALCVFGTSFFPPTLKRG